MIKEGVWVVGDGRSIRSFIDRWVLEAQGYIVRPVETTSPQPELNVGDWIDQDTCRWNETAVREAMRDRDVDVFLLLHIPWDRRKNVMKWPRTRNGKVTVRSAYHSITCTKQGSGETNNSEGLNMWAAIWKTYVWPKVQVFMWELAANVLVVRSNLARMGIQLNPTCPSCEDIETREHVILGCWARQVWAGLQGMELRAQVPGSLEVWLGNQLTTPGASKEVIECDQTKCMITRFIWKSRCRLIYENKVPNPMVII